MEGTRPLLVEVQALVAPTEVVPPRRVANGIDRNRLAMILAVLSRHGGVAIGGADVFVNVAGGSGSTSRAPTSRSRSRSRRPTAASRSATPRAARSPASARSA